MTTDEKSPDLENLENKPQMPLTRETLYELVWSEPMLKVAARYDVSSSYMARVCTLLNVPRPKPGYWNKLAVGKVSPITPLPDPRPGDELAWSRDGQNVRMARQLPRPPSEIPKRRPKSTPVNQGQHPLVKGAKEIFEAGRLSYNSTYLKPMKKLLIDLIVSKTGLDKALAFANQLFLKFEEYGYRVVIAPTGEQFHRAEVDEHEDQRRPNRGYNNLWSPWRCTVVYIGTVAIGLTIIEMSEEVEVRYVNGQYIREKDYIPSKRGLYAYDHSWTTKKDFLTGRLCLQAYSPYPRAKWVKHWRETKNENLSDRIRTIVKELELATVDIARLVEEGERQAEIERERWEAQKEKWDKEEAEKRAAKALKDSREDLLQIIARWTEANRIEQFFLDAEQHAAGLSDNEQRLKIFGRLKTARELVGNIDAYAYFLKWKSPDERRFNPF